MRLTFKPYSTEARVSPASAVDLPPRRRGGADRRPPRDPAASANVARGLQALLPWRDPGRMQISPMSDDWAQYSVIGRLSSVIAPDLLTANG